VLIACRSTDEAHYACAVLNSSIVSFLVAAHSVPGGKGFGTPSLLDFIKLRQFNPADPRHQELAACSRQAHQQLAEGLDAATTEDRVNHLAAQLWGLSNDELVAIHGG
jgi:hypothetical protein